MYDLKSLIKRNTISFLRDKAAVFFSLLSALILIVIYFLFLGKQYTTGLDFASEELKIFLSTSVMMGAILIINTISLSTGTMGNIVNDLQNNKLNSFLVTPVKRYKIILSYFITSVLVTTTITLLMWLGTVLYVGIISGYWYTFLTILKISGLLILFTLISTSFMMFVISFIKSVNAFGVVSGISGSFIGMVCGIYMPLFILGKTMRYIASIFPFTHMTILLKQALLKEPYALLPTEAVTNLSEMYGSNEIGILEQPVSTIWIMLGSVLISILLLFLAYKNMSKKMGK